MVKLTMVVKLTMAKAQLIMINYTNILMASRLH
jgi:hypothetical protein